MKKKIFSDVIYGCSFVSFTCIPEGVNENACLIFLASFKESFQVKIGSFNAATNPDLTEKALHLNVKMKKNIIMICKIFVNNDSIQFIH